MVLLCYDLLMNSIFKIDDKIFVYIQRSVGKYSWLDDLLIFMAQYLIYTIPVLLIILWFWSVPVKKAVFKSLIAVVIAWLGLAKLVAVLVNRPRPAEAILNAKELLFHRPDTSFPSDHATMMFALALSLRLYGLKKLGNTLLVVAVLISISRVWVGVHFPFDVIAGAILGCFVAWIVWLCRNFIDRYLTNPLLGFLKKFRL